MYREEEIRRKAMQTLSIVTGLFIVILGLIIFVSNDLKSALVYLVILYLVNRNVIEMFVLGQRKKILNDQVQFNNDIRQYYYETKLLDDAMEYAADDAMKRGNKEIARQGYKMVKVLQASDKEEEITNYNASAPNKFLKLLLGLSYLTQEYGDTIVNNTSSYSLSIDLLNKEINLEFYKKDKIGYTMKSLDIMILIPLLASSFAKNWLSTMFYDLGTYFDSSYGLLTDLAMFLVVIVSYYVLQKKSRRYR